MVPSAIVHDCTGHKCSITHRIMGYNGDEHPSNDNERLDFQIGSFIIGRKFGLDVLPPVAILDYSSCVHIYIYIFFCPAFDFISSFEKILPWDLSNEILEGGIYGCRRFFEEFIDQSLSNSLKIPLFLKKGPKINWWKGCKWKLSCKRHTCMRNIEGDG